MRRFAWKRWLAAWLLIALVGCSSQPGPSSGLRWPWQNAPPSAAAASPSAADPLEDQRRGWSFLAELQRRADQQKQLAEQQQRRLAQLRQLQRETDQQLLATRQQQQLSQRQSVRQQIEQAEKLAQLNRELTARYREIEQRAESLDANNRELHAQLARSQQQVQITEDQVALLQRRLNETTNQLAEARRAAQQSDQRLEALQASLRQQPGATITANTSMRRSVTAMTIPGLSVRQDADLVRIEVPSDQLFQSGTATLKPGAETVIDRVAQAIGRYYPEQIVGIEVHTDTTPLTGTLWRNAHQLTAAQAMAVFEQLSVRNQLPARQLFVLGHGANHPIASNATPAGQAQNRRIEVVIYPETFSRS